MHLGEQKKEEKVRRTAWDSQTSSCVGCHGWGCFTERALVGPGEVQVSLREKQREAACDVVYITDSIVFLGVISGQTSGRA